MKNTFKKVTFGMLFTVLVITLSIINKDHLEEVKAAGGCPTHTNYYFYSLVASYDSYLDEEFPYHRVHTSYFSDELPEGAVVDTAQYNWLDLGSGENGWTIRKFWNIKYYQPDELDVVKNGDEWYFLHAPAWVDDGKGEESEDAVDVTEYNIEDIIRNSYYAEASDGTMALRIQDSATDTISGTIVRRIEDTWIDFAAMVKAQANGTEHPTHGQIWLPAVLEVTFEVCEEIEEPDTEYNVVVKYVDNESGDTLKSDKDLGKYATGEEYSATCDDAIGEYKLVSQKELGGVMADSNVTLYCRYSKSEPEPEPEPEPEYNVVVKYIDDESEEEIRNQTNLGKFKKGEEYSTTCFDTVSDYQLTSEKELSGTMADSDVTLYCRYKKPEPEPEPEPEYSVIIKYIDDETEEEIEEQTNLGKFKKGEKYSAPCFDTINNFQLVSQKEINGTVEDKNVILYCRYREPEPEPTYSLTINYLGKTTKEPLRDPIVQINKYTTGDKYTATCLDSIGSTYILDSYTGNLTGTFADQDIEINCLYTTEAIQTSDMPIYIICIFGVGALIYSIIYIRKRKLN